jgi:hypothetical protein
VTEAVALGREPERRRGLRWWEPARRTCRQWRRTGARAQRGREENSNLGRDGGRHCFENNWLGGAGREREKGEGGRRPRGGRRRERGVGLRSSRQCWAAGSCPQTTGVGCGAVS